MEKKKKEKKKNAKYYLKGDSLPRLLVGATI